MKKTPLGEAISYIASFPTPGARDYYDTLKPGLAIQIHEMDLDDIATERTNVPGFDICLTYHGEEIIVQEDMDYIELVSVGNELKGQFPGVRVEYFNSKGGMTLLQDHD